MASDVSQSAEAGMVAAPAETLDTPDKQVAARQSLLQKLWHGWVKPVGAAVLVVVTFRFTFAIRPLARGVNFSQSMSVRMCAPFISV